MNNNSIRNMSSSKEGTLSSIKDNIVFLSNYFLSVNNYKSESYFDTYLDCIDACNESIHWLIKLNSRNSEPDFEKLNLVNKENSNLDANTFVSYLLGQINTYYESISGNTPAVIWYYKNLAACIYKIQYLLQSVDLVQGTLGSHIALVGYNCNQNTEKINKLLEENKRLEETITTLTSSFEKLTKEIDTLSVKDVPNSNDSVKSTKTTSKTTTAKTTNTTK